MNLCKVLKGEGAGRYECSVLSCAWKAPRVLTGSLASTPLPQSSSSSCNWRSRRQWRRQSHCPSTVSSLCRAVTVCFS